MKVVIIGDGKVGHILAKQLSEQDYDVVIIDTNINNLMRSVNNLDINYVEGNGIDVDVMKEAEVPESDLVIACTSTDEVNMICCLLARKLGAKQTIARVRNPIYYKQMDLIKDDLHLSMSVNPEFVMAEEIARTLIYPEAANVDTFVKGRVELVEIKIGHENMFTGMTLAEIYKKHHIKFLVCAVQRKQEVFIPDGSFVMEPDDKIHIAVSQPQIKYLFKVMNLHRSKVKEVMICGGSRTAYYLAKKLLYLGMEVRIIEKDERRCQELSELLPKASIIKGDATEHEVLKEEGIDMVDAVVSLTGIDEENIVISMYASSEQITKVVTKINSESLIKIAESINLETIVSPKKLTAELIMSYVRAMENSLASANVEALYPLVEGKVEALEFRLKANSYYLEIPLKELRLKENILIAAIARGRNIIIPSGDDVLKARDSVVVVTKDRQIQDFKEILNHREH